MNFWESLRLGFAQLRADCAINPPLNPAGRLIAIWTSQPEPAHWRLSHWDRKDGNGVRERFQWHAQSAAARLGFTGGGDDAVSVWLDRIKLDAPESHLRKMVIQGEGLYSVEILDICGLSADYCRKCEAEETMKGTLAQEITEALTQLPDLPPKFQDAFEARRAKAELAYANRAERLPHHSDVSESIHRIKLRQDIFFAYCKEARNACRAGSMTVAQARKATDAALPSICDSYFVRDHGNCSAEAKSAFQVHFTRGITDDPQWKRHLSELVTLAESPSNLSPGDDGEHPGPAKENDAPRAADLLKLRESPPPARHDMARPRRLQSAISSPSAAQRMEAYLESNPMKRTAFAVQAQTTDRTLRSFRKTGKVRRDIFENIARAMGITAEALLNPE